jgi:hypothetical protein
VHEESVEICKIAGLKIFCGACKHIHINHKHFFNDGRPYRIQKYEHRYCGKNHIEGDYYHEGETGLPDEYVCDDFEAKPLEKLLEMRKIIEEADPNNQYLEVKDGNM